MLTRGIMCFSALMLPEKKWLHQVSVIPLGSERSIFADGMCQIGHVHINGIYNVKVCKSS